MTKEEIFDYVMESPENTNPAILRSMLNELSSGSGGGGIFPVEINDEFTIADKTSAEIEAALLAKQFPVLFAFDQCFSFTNLSRDGMGRLYASFMYANGEEGVVGEIQVKHDGSAEIVPFEG